MANSHIYIRKHYDNLEEELPNKITSFTLFNLQLDKTGVDGQIKIIRYFEKDWTHNHHVNFVTHHDTNVELSND